MCARLRQFGGFHYKSFTLLYKYNSLVVLILDYGACLWGYQQYSQLTLVQNHAMRFILGCSKTMPLVALTGDMDWLPTHARHMFIILKVYIQLEQNTCNPITQYAYKQSSH